MRTISVLHPHPFADLMPMMSGDELHSLCEDISRNGQREPIILFEGKILDGRNRYAACAKLGVEPICENWNRRGSAIEFVMSKNMHRRNLTASQKAAVAVEALPHFESLAKERMRSGRPCRDGAVGQSRDLCGAIFGISGRYVAQACKLKKENEELFLEVFKGNLPLSHATRFSRRAKASKKYRELDGAGIAMPILPERTRIFIREMSTQKTAGLTLHGISASEIVEVLKSHFAQKASV